jgi:hypothetical protein
MVIAALDALVGVDPDDEAVAEALTTVPAAELADALRLFARVHGVGALPVLRRCLAARPEWASAAAAALATLNVPDAAAVLAEAEARTAHKPVRTAIRRALYRLRQAGIAPPEAPPAPRVRSRPQVSRAWGSAIDGTGTRGLWLVLDSPRGDRTLVSAVISDQDGVLDAAAGPVSRKRLDERLAALVAESPLRWVELPAGWAARLMLEAVRRHQARDTPLPGDLGRWLDGLEAPDPAAEPPVYAHLAVGAVTADPTLLERSADVLALPELSSWFVDPPALQSDALELLQARESRLVVSDQIKAEREAALTDRVIDRLFDAVARGRWRHRLEETAFVLVATGRAPEARLALAAASALADDARAARHVPFVRALVAKSLEIAGEVALGRVSAVDASRQPRGPEPPGRP